VPPPLAFHCHLRLHSVHLKIGGHYGPTSPASRWNGWTLTQHDQAIKPNLLDREYAVAEPDYVTQCGI